MPWHRHHGNSPGKARTGTGWDGCVVIVGKEKGEKMICQIR